MLPSARHRVRRYGGLPGRVLCAAAFSACCLSPWCGAAETAPENAVKAAFLLNFTKFTDWPPEAFADQSSPINICIMGKDPFGAVLNAMLEGEVVNGRRLALRRMTEAPGPRACQVVYIDTPAKELRVTLAGLGPRVLTVGEGEGFVRDGGMIGFVVENRRVRFDINLTAVEEASLKLSSRLLNVARSVQK